jgi:Uma2 family endonuclease
MGERGLKYYTAEEYLAFERASQTKHELYKGKISDIAGASLNHRKLQMNFITAFGVFLKDKSCNVFGSDLRIHVPANGLFTYPNAIIICGTPHLMDEAFDTVLNPAVIVEISAGFCELSPATQQYDRGEKFMLYRSITSLQEYILIDSESISIEHYKRNNDNTWLLQEWKQRTDTLTIVTLGLSLLLEELYSGVSI